MQTEDRRGPELLWGGVGGVEGESLGDRFGKEELAGGPPARPRRSWQGLGRSRGPWC